MDQINLKSHVGDINKDYLIIRIHVDHYERLCKLIERDEKVRERSRESNRSKRGPTSATRSIIVKPIKYEILSS